MRNAISIIFLLIAVSLMGGCNGDGTSAAGIVDQVTDQLGDGSNLPGPAPEVEYPTVVQRDPKVWPFSPESPWNMPIGDGAKYEARTDDCTDSIASGANDTNINSELWSHPVYLATTSDPMTSIYNSANGREQMKINIPANAESALPFNTDSHLHIIEPNGRYIVEMWRALPRNGGGWNADYATKLDLYGPGVLQGGARAYGGSAIGGLIRKGELKNGIRHALAIAMPWTKLWPGGAIWPANKTDEDPANNYTGHYAMGQLAAIPPTINLEALDPPLSPQALAIGRAMQDFGVYNVDGAGAHVIYVEPAASAEIGDALHDLPRLWSLLRCITNNTPQTPGGGGSKRRAPMAPSLKPQS